MGTLKWSVLDNDGHQHTWLLPNSYHIPKAKVKLFSPQHWAQCMAKEGDVAHSSTGSQTTTMTWNNGGATLDIP